MGRRLLRSQCELPQIKLIFMLYVILGFFKLVLPVIFTHDQEMVKEIHCDVNFQSKY